MELAALSNISAAENRACHPTAVVFSNMFYVQWCQCDNRPSMREIDTDLVKKSRIAMDSDAALESGDLYTPIEQEKTVDKQHIVGRLGQFIQDPNGINIPDNLPILRRNKE